MQFVCIPSLVDADYSEVRSVDRQCGSLIAYKLCATLTFAAVKKRSDVVITPARSTPLEIQSLTLPPPYSFQCVPSRPGENQLTQIVAPNPNAVRAPPTLHLGPPSDRRASVLCPQSRPPSACAPLVCRNWCQMTLRILGQVTGH